MLQLLSIGLVNLLLLFSVCDALTPTPTSPSPGYSRNLRREGTCKTRGSGPQYSNMTLALSLFKESVFSLSIRQEEVCSGSFPVSCGNDRCCTNEQPTCCSDGVHCCEADTQCLLQINECCPNGAETCNGSACCESGSACCGGGKCCSPGEICCDEGDTCCLADTTCCGNGCCDSGDKCCDGGNACCKPDAPCCGNTCCDVGGTCCPGDVCCDEGETCCGDVCCFEGAQCCEGGDLCCEDDATCCGEVCCPDATKCCGGWCCLEGFDCGDATGTCNPPPMPTMTFIYFPGLTDKMVTNICLGMQKRGQGNTDTLTYSGTGKAARRQAAGCVPGRCASNPGTTCDEYPFASTLEGGSASAVSNCIPAEQNTDQGSYLKWWYFENGYFPSISDGSQFGVEVVGINCTDASLTRRNVIDLNGTQSMVLNGTTFNAMTGDNKTDRVILPVGDIAAGDYSLSFMLPSNKSFSSAYILDNEGDTFASLNASNSTDFSASQSVDFQLNDDGIGLGMVLYTSDKNTSVTWDFTGTPSPSPSNPSSDVNPSLTSASISVVVSIGTSDVFLKAGIGLALMSLIFLF